MAVLELGGRPYARPSAWGDKQIIDVDVHCSARSLQDISEFLESRWRDYLTESGIGQSESNLYPSRVSGVFLDGSGAPESRPGVDLGMLQEQLLDPWQTGVAVVNPTFAFDAFHNDDLAAALCSAANRWLLEEWLRIDSRLRGSALVPVQNPQLAATEIGRVSEHSEFVQVMLPARTREPLGRRGYWPIYEAASEAGLPIAVHAGGMSGNPITPVGWPSYYLEDYAGVSQAFQTQMLSMVSEGVFSMFPELKVVFLESGFTWLPALMWRFDKNWKGLRREVPWVTEYPSDIIRKHFRIATQPLDAPASSQELIDVIDQIESDDVLMFSTDYPHLQFGAADSSLPDGLSEEQLEAILNRNAHNLYTL